MPLADFQEMEKKLDQFYFSIKIKEKKSRYPNFYTYNKLNVQIPKNAYMDAMKRLKIFQKRKGRNPQSIRINGAQILTKSSWEKEKNYHLEYQDTGYTCGPSTLVESLDNLGIETTEAHLSKLAGTTVNGTSHEGLKKAVAAVSKETQIPLRINYYYLKDIGYSGILKAIKDPKTVCGAHGRTGKRGWEIDFKKRKIWKGSFGHYCGIAGISIEKELIELSDPTKGFVTYTWKEFENGINLVGQPSILVLSKP